MNTAATSWEALPEMASQIILLVYEGEMPPSQARPTLKGQAAGGSMFWSGAAPSTPSWCRAVKRRRRDG